MNKINRVEVINHSSKREQGRIFVFWEKGVEATCELQDDGRTLKVFISDTK